MSLLLLLSLGCDRENTDFIPLPIDGYPGIAHLDPLSPIDASNVGFNDDGAVVLHELGPPEVGTKGGATTTFIANGNVICLVVDPEAVFWNQSVSAQDPVETYYWPENFRDDGDIDMEVGLSAYYTGSPGVEMGDFAQLYEDSLGNEIEVEFNECTMFGRFGQDGQHAGRGTPEFCEIDTSLHPGRAYTVVLNTWSLPLDDYILSYKVAAFDATAIAQVNDPEATTGTCADVLSYYGSGSDWECMFKNEAQNEAFADFEPWYCGGQHSNWCDCTSDPDPDNDACVRLEENASVDFDWDAGVAEWNDQQYDLVYPDACGEL